VRVIVKTCVSCVAIDHILDKNNLILISNEYQIFQNKEKGQDRVLLYFYSFLHSRDFIVAALN